MNIGFPRMPAPMLVSAAQWDILLSYMEANPNMGTSLKSPLDLLCIHNRMNRWVQLKNLLNDVKGCRRTVGQWREYWTTAQRKAQQKFRRIKKNKSTKCVLPIKRITLTDRDMRIIKLTGEVKDDPDMIDTTIEVISDFPECSNETPTPSVDQILKLDKDDQGDSSPSAITSDLTGTVLTKPEIAEHMGHLIKERRFLSGPDGSSTSQVPYLKVKTDKDLFGTAEERGSNASRQSPTPTAEIIEIDCEVLPVFEKMTSQIKVQQEMAPEANPQPKSPDQDEGRQTAVKQPNPMMWPYPRLSATNARRLLKLEERKVAIEEQKIIIAKREADITERKLARAERDARALEEERAIRRHFQSGPDRVDLTMIVPNLKRYATYKYEP